ncbi:hypothetical protein EPA93_00180 [Ktedonosporobacter rubrisoli]|uniref:Uncharacterized protein n=1 Tax=Ktedonosporobacter rubrisoli TaxID=2509675 RepID=A0A4P6JHK4_KTERU|nr:hypothetical protein [Ktedonosporobacter rubrisoli]QBD74494.1 hypothetical protein EPA93_00180 [Ktedonosporobacter rubrisoli]
MPHTAVLETPVIEQPNSLDEFELDVRISIPTRVPHIVASGSDCDACTSAYNSCRSCDPATGCPSCFVPIKDIH